ncbi:hypothetical protein PJ900_00770 (plasmid) [Tistrella mobilis]|uniref:Uncharacterized protein n=1 Tax=Tistrella mobilis TaxID=171437 RepID=A0A161PZM0_9PROT|nr:hypothetical protein [Tistrella mobilis]KYO57487.1 hypothetical protein AUP44_19920 [Tistrella mobilis]
MAPMMETIARSLPDRRGLGRILLLCLLAMAASGLAGYLLETVLPEGLMAIAYLATGIFFLALFIAFAALNAILAKTTFENRRTRPTPDRIPKGLRIYMFLFTKDQLRRLAGDNLLGNAFSVQCVAIWIIGLVIAAVLPVQAGAAGRLMTEPVTPRPEIAAGYSRVPYGDARRPGTNFSVLIPHGWTTHALPPRAEETDGLAVLAAWSAPDGDVRLEVAVQRMRRELAPADWMVEWLTANDWQVLDARRLPGAAGAQGDVLAAREGRVHRLRSYKSGDLMFLVDASVSRDGFAAAEETLFVATEGFRLEGLIGGPYAEPMREAAWDGPIPAWLLVPAAWKMAADDRLPRAAGRQFTATDAGGRPVGLIYVGTLAPEAATDHAALAAAVAETLRTRQDLTFDTPTLDRVSAPGATAEVQTGSTTAVNPAGVPVRVEMTIVREPRGWVVFALAGTRPDPDPYLIDAANRRVFEIVRGSFGGG